MQNEPIQIRHPLQTANRSRYHVVNHAEAGLFDSMTGATIWALKNLSGWNWQVEPVSAQRGRWNR